MSKLFGGTSTGNVSMFVFYSIFQLKPYQPTYILAEQDKDGVNPDILRQALEKQRKAGGKMPKVLSFVT